MHIKLDFNGMTYCELVETIRECQNVLNDRGTVTTCRIEDPIKVYRTKFIEKNGDDIYA